MRCITYNRTVKIDGHIYYVQFMLACMQQFLQCCERGCQQQYVVSVQYDKIYVLVYTTQQGRLSIHQIERVKAQSFMAHQTQL